MQCDDCLAGRQERGVIARSPANGASPKHCRDKVTNQKTSSVRREDEASDATRLQPVDIPPFRHASWPLELLRDDGTRPNGVGVFLTGGEARFHFEDGTTEEISWKAVNAAWFPATNTIRRI